MDEDLSIDHNEQHDDEDADGVAPRRLNHHHTNVKPPDLSAPTPESDAAARREKLRVQREGLPVCSYRDQIVGMLTSSPVVIVVGETGSGKSTQICQYLQDSEDFRTACFGAQHKDSIRIAITQPRRVAAVATAKRVADERGGKIGGEVAYSIRFDDTASPRTRIRFLTDGCLLRECLHDRHILNYQVIILDEAHERSVSTDVLFGIIKGALAVRAGNLRVLVTSATLNTELFSKYFGNAPVLNIPGRCYPVDIHYSPLTKGGTARVEACVNAALRLHMEENDHPCAHILIFVTGMEECERGCTMAYDKLQALMESGREVGDVLIVPLYGALASEDQHLVFEEVPLDCRKIVFATNIAETSLTVDNVGFVIDSGYVKQKSYNAKTGMDLIQTMQVSKVQAEQRTGRAGRTKAGKCFRLYSIDNWKHFQAVTTPEIQRVNLSAVVLQLKCMGINDVLHFDFLEPPSTTALLLAYRLLYLLKAIDAEGAVTTEGQFMVEVPLEPTYARCVLASTWLDVTDEMLTLVAILSSENVWVRPSKQNEAAVNKASRAHKQFHHATGDHLSLLTVFSEWLDNRTDRRPDWCKSHFISHRSLRMAMDIRRQLREQLDKIHIPRKPADDADSRLVEVRRVPTSERVRRALCAGLFMHTARRSETVDAWVSVGESTLARPERDSALEDMDPPPQWLIYSELSGQSAGAAILRCVSVIDREWVDELLKRMDHVDLKKLANYHPADSTADGRGRGRKRVLEKDPAAPEAAVSTEEQGQRVMSAKERYLARKKQGS
mmetsp:Transcript_42619/g.120870  ORF Transcript_42619/g.120870 Transcript_42619/m.120870 type:complete len:782 (-) Transcript_42619:573-2918(-)